jgi:hypothetical protein
MFSSRLQFIGGIPPPCGERLGHVPIPHRGPSRFRERVQAAAVNAALDAIANTRLDGVTLDLKLAGEMTFRVSDDRLYTRR